MKRSFHTSAAGTVLSVARLLAAVGLVGLAWSCGRTIEEEEPRARLVGTAEAPVISQMDHVSPSSSIVSISCAVTRAV
jgi:hypothetical protein